MKLCSLDYFQEIQKIANVDKEFLAKAKGFTATFTYKVTDRPDLPPAFMKFEEGKVTEVRLLNPEEKTVYRLEADYDTWTKISTGELDGATAIMTRQMGFFGSLGDIMKYAKAFQRLLTLMMEVKVEN